MTFDFIEINTLKAALRFYIDSENYDDIETLNEILDLHDKLERMQHDLWQKNWEKSNGCLKNEDPDDQNQSLQKIKL